MEPNQTNQSIQVKQQRYQDTIDLVELFYLLLGHAGQIILCVVLGAVVAFAGTFYLIKPQYQATSKIYILSASNDSVVNLSDLQIGAQLTADYQELLVSRPLLEDVIKNLNLSYSYKNLASHIKITNTNNTRILQITVTEPEPQLAADIANELVDQAIIYLPRIMGTDPPNVVETAVVPTEKSSPSYSRNTVLGALLLSVVYCGILIVRYLMNDTIVTPDDVEQLLGIQPLTVIPEGNLGSFNKSKKKNTKKKKGAKA